ncbi:MAG TPA: phosphodiester glycosidase family protein, partial [Luteitalea sp.]|nr:phosphodiester glycosidase family protein [Luteitalea sp.]
MRRPIILLLLAALSTIGAGGVDVASLARQGAQVAAARDAGRQWLGAPERIADGVDLFRVDGFHLGGADVPQSIRLLRLDPRRVRMASALATDDIPGRARVLDIAREAGALAAVNAGFFSPPGEPVGLLRVNGRLVSDTRRLRGAVALLEDANGAALRFGQAGARVTLHFRVGQRWRAMPIDGVDTVRGRGQLVLFTPASGPTTDTTGGREWVVGQERGANGQPVWRVSPPSAAGNSAIPRDGYVLSRSGDVVPAALTSLSRATAVRVEETILVHGQARTADWQRAAAIIGGAGLLVQNGRPLTDWTRERLSKGFDVTRHPRTVIARDRTGAVWLITIDGRQPGR